MKNALAGEIVVEGTNKEEVGEIQSKVEVKPNMVRFWSPLQSFKIAIHPGVNLAFNNHVLSLRADDPDAEIIRKHMPYDAREIVDRPFGSDDSLAKFNKFLNDLIFIGVEGEPTPRGIQAVEGMFSLAELQDITTIGRQRADMLVIRAIKGKSFKGGI